MEEQSIKTSTGQRIVIGIIAVLMLFATIGVYALIVLGGEASSRLSAENEAKLAEYETQLTDLGKELQAADTALSDKHFGTFSKYLSHAKSYNANTVDNAGLVTKDFVVGNGAEIQKGSTYSAYYIGWCANEEIFDSSFDDTSKPTSISPISADADSSFIAGWDEGVIGMKIGGIREIDIPGELAYGEQREICGGYNSPLKFIVYAIDPGADYTTIVNKYNQTYMEYVQLYYTVNGLE